MWEMNVGQSSSGRKGSWLLTLQAFLEGQILGWSQLVNTQVVPTDSDIYPLPHTWPKGKGHPWGMDDALLTALNDPGIHQPSGLPYIAGENSEGLVAIRCFAFSHR